MRHRALTFSAVLALALVSAPAPSRVFAAAPAGGIASIQASDLKEWLSTLASDDYDGRATYSEGLGLAAAYIAEHLHEWGVKPGGDHGSFFQRVAVKSVKAASRSSVTVTVNGQSRTFADGQGITFPRNAGGKQSLVSAEVEFVGYGLNLPPLGYNDYADRNVAGKVAVWIGGQGPKGAEAATFRRLLGGRGRFAIDDRQAIATIGQAGPAGVFGGGGRGGNAPSGPASDFTTVQRLDVPVPPTLTAEDQFFEFLFSGSDVTYAELKDKASRQEPLPHFTLRNTSISVNVDHDYQIVRTQYTRNVVGIVEGSDAALRESYVAFGAHYDHVGYAENDVAGGGRRSGTPGRVKEGALDDRVWNGADDDGSGTVALMALARAFALGPHPKRSTVFVWHAGEERGLLGSRYFADYPTVPIDKVVAQLNMDMIGRNRDDKPEEGNRVYLVGSDRISTELHNLSEDANRGLKQPLTLDYEMNDPSDLEQVYYRSDHYSYAAKGVPIIFYTTGLHPDYHANTDSVDRILFDKMARIAQLVYATGTKVANLDHAPARDRQGPRAGKNTHGKLQVAAP